MQVPILRLLVRLGNLAPSLFIPSKNRYFGEVRKPRQQQVYIFAGEAGNA